jgi:hypothetical protein
MSRLTLSFNGQTLEILHPEGLADDVRSLFAAAEADVAAPGHSIAVAEDGEGGFRLTAGGEEIAAGLDGRAIFDCLQEEVARQLAADAANAVLLHAAAVALGDRSILIPGPTGAGKSSLAAWLVANGFTYLTDEMTALIDGRSLLGFPRALGLKGKSAALDLPGFLPERLIASAAGAIAALPVARCGSPVPRECRAIVFPRYQEGAALGIAALPAAQAGLRLIACNHNARNLPDEGFGDMVALSRAVPAISLTYGHFDQLDRVLDVFLRLLAGRDSTPADIRRFVAAFADPAAPGQSAPPPAAPVFAVPAATAPRPAAKLTIGMATYDDYDGVYFSLQAIRLFHPEILADVSFLVIDNHPDGPCGEPLKRLENHIANYRYVPAVGHSGTAIRDRVFAEADSTHVLCMDCHVFVVPGALKRLLAWLDAHPGTVDLLQGPLVFDDLQSIATHFHPEWRAGMYGYWEHDARADADGAEPFDIPMQGLGLFACRKAAWPGFNPAFRGFGGEEGYIHEKFRQAGGRTLCLPFLRWMHRFERPLGTRYPNRWPDRIRNYLIGFREIGWPTDAIVDHFRTHLGPAEADRVIEAIELELAEERTLVGQ